MTASWPRVRGSNLVRAVLHLAGASRIADAAKELSDGRPGASGDFSEVPAELAATVLNQASHEFRHAAEGDLSSAEAALEELLASAPERETLSHALRSGEALRAYLLDDRGGRKRRAGLLSDDAQRYFDRLLDLTCGFVSLTVHRTGRSGQAERAGIAEMLVSTDLLRKAVAEVLDPQRSAQQPNSLASDLLEAVRSAGADAWQSTQPEILPGMDRLALLERAVGPVDALEKPLVILGEGGLGKSVLAGQLFGRFESEGDTTAIFVLCTRIPASAELSSAAAVDLALGQAASGVREAAPLTAILAAAPGRVIVIVDTLDLILTEDNADDISYVLRQVARQALLLMTCRDQEWHSYLEPERDLVGALYRLPNLTPDEIGEWADAYVRASAIPQERRASFAASLTERLSGAGVRDVFSSPLRLAMACDIYAAAGAVPAGLTVTRLYEAYWERRVARDRRGRRADRAAHQVRTAEALAASVWAASGNRFVEFVPANDSMTGLSQLLSEGSVQEVGGRYAFFHQTYAEFAVARHLAIHGTEADLARLEDGLRTGMPGYWAIAKHLLMLAIDRARLEELAAHVPRDSVEGIRIHFQSALARGDGDLVEHLAAELKQHRPALLIASVDVLEPATGSCVGPALEVALWCLEHADSASFSRVEMTVGPLINAAEPAQQQAGFATALRLCLQRLADDGRRDAGPVIRRLLEQTVLRGTTAVDVRVLVDRYSQLPETARAAVLAFAQRAGDSRLKADLVARALRHRCPAGAVDDAAAALADVWQDPAVQTAGGWTDWQSMLSASLRDRWVSSQLTVMRRLCADRVTALELLAVAFDPDLPAERTPYMNAVIRLAADHPELVARAVIEASDTTSTPVLGTVATVARYLADRLDAPTRSQLAAALENHLPDQPHRIWPVVIKLNSDNPTRLREYLDRLTLFAGNAAELMHGRATLRRGFDAIVFSASPAVVRELEAELTAVCSSPDPADAERMARLQGRLTPVSAAAREWISEELLERDRLKVVRAATKAVAASLDDWRAEAFERVGLPWVLGLLESGHQYAVTVLAPAVEKRSSTLPETWGPVLVDRLVRSIVAGEDTQVQTVVIRLIAVIDRTTGISAADVVRILETYLEAVQGALGALSEATAREASAGYARLLDAITTLGMHHLTADELGDLVVRVLTTIDSAAVVWRRRSDADMAGKPRVNLGNMLVGVVAKQPLVLPRLEDAWERCSASNKAAIAQCVSLSETGTRGVVSLRLARRDDCPPDIANLLHARFGG
ncbi:NACHT domain-containing protein [Kribbella sp. CA-294648]|uniref:NACHT domain-containing protein n=1 Tax=Kribbella sp. CA-294648 TaxID=3239948 RepID=UPI003D8BAAF5